MLIRANLSAGLFSSSPRQVEVQVRRLGQIRAMKTLACAIVEKNRVTNRIPNSGQMHRPRTAQREVQAAWFAVSFENLFVDLEGSGDELFSVTDRPFHESTKIVQRGDF